MDGEGEERTSPPRAAKLFPATYELMNPRSCLVTIRQVCNWFVVILYLGLLGELNGNKKSRCRYFPLKILNYLLQLNPSFRLKPKTKTNSVCIGTQT